MAVFTFSHSNGRYAVFLSSKYLGFYGVASQLFREVGGAPSMMVYDNMRVAIKEFVGAEKKPTEALLRLSNLIDAIIASVLPVLVGKRTC